MPRRRRTFSEAARRLHLTQPAVSLNIKALERQLGIDLFQNVGRNVVLTDAGRSLLPMARDLVAFSNQIEESVCALRGQVVGQLKIGCAASAGRYVLPAVIGRFRQLYPEVRVSVVTMDSQALADRLLDRQVHIGVTCLAEKHADLEYRELLEDDLVLIAAPGHPWAQRDAVALRDVAGVDLILREEGAGSRQILLEAMAHEGIRKEDLSVVMELGSCEEVELAVETGLGVAFVSRVASARTLASGRVVTIPVPEVNLRHKIYMARNRKQASSCAHLKFCDLIHSREMAAALEPVVAA